MVIGSLSPTFSLRGVYYLIDTAVVEERTEEGIVHPRHGSIQNSTATDGDAEKNVVVVGGGGGDAAHGDDGDNV